jgi:WD40 repeat protein
MGTCDRVSSNIHKGGQLFLPVKSVCTAQCEGHSKIINQFANIGRDELVTGAADGTIRFWNWKDGELLDTLHAHENAVTGFKLTEQHIISAGMDGKVCIWHRSDKSLYRDLRPKVSAVWKLTGRGNALVLVMRIEAGKHLVEIWDSSSL